ARKVDGVVCGHIHTAEFREFDGIAYYNDGDWVEGCTALVEHFDGTMEILHWPEEIARRTAQALVVAGDQDMARAA
ncbi:MAG TPA: UDP-2,3-diacylglucosamine diphosphatase, partial [Croceibacterium sp.]|nr:UDP-2,3-diacylglucosamine diphosphatase [Croceibacterium sp.]